MFASPNKIYTVLICYSETARSESGNMVMYFNRSSVIPDKNWEKIEIPFDDFVPSAWTKNHVSNYSPKPEFHNTLTLFFMFSSFKGDGGHTGSNTVWIDEIVLK